MKPKTMKLVLKGLVELNQKKMDRFVQLRNLIDELIVRSKEGAVIVVEGLKDVAALRNLGVKGEILTSSNISSAKLVDAIGRREVIILTDFDKRGNLMEKKLINKLSSWGVTPNVELKKRVFSLVLKDITAIEGLAEYYTKAKSELGF